MCSFKLTFPRNRKMLAAFICALAMAARTVSADPGDFVIGAGIETDSEDGLAFSLLADVAVGDRTWLSASASHSGVDSPVRQSVDYLYADVGVDHYFDPVGVRVSVAYWGNEDLLDSNDLRGSLYSRGDTGLISIDAERRDFDFTVPALDVLPRVGVGFDANGLGLSGRLEVSPTVSVRASGMSYEYSRDFRIGDATRLRDLLIFSRLSVLTSLVDWRANAGVDFDIGSRQLQLSLTRWRGIVDRSDNVGATVSFLTPLTRRTDVEFSLGYDDSDLYGNVTYLSAFVYFYGGN